MITYCSKCDINWARLWEQTDDANDETYEFCPQCKSSMDLHPGTDIVSYIKCPFTGKITNVETGKSLEFDKYKPVLGTAKKVKVFDETYEQWRERVEAIENTTPLNESVPRIDRKHHFEFI